MRITTMPNRFICFTVIFTLIFYAMLPGTKCGAAQANKQAAETTNSLIPDREGFHKMVNGKQTDLFTLKNKSGMSVAITNYGGRIVSLLVPDKNGKLRDVSIGYKTIDDYIK